MMAKRKPPKKTYDQLLEMCVAARNAFEKEEVRFLLVLYKVERDYMKVLSDYGIPSFERFLEPPTGVHLTSAARYRSFVNGLKRCTEVEALAMGAPAVIRLASARNTDAAKVFKANVAAWTVKNSGLRPSDKTTLKLLRDAQGVEAKAVPSSRQIELIALREEVKFLRKRCHTLERENARLKAQLGKDAA